MSAVRFLVAAIGLSLIATSQALAVDLVRIENHPGQLYNEKLIRRVYERAGIEMTVSPAGGKRALSQSTSGEMDGEVARIYAIGERFPTLVRVPTVISEAPINIYARTDAALDLSDPAKVQNLTVALIAGVLHTHHYTADHLPGAKVIDVKTAEQTFRLVDAGRADILISDLYSAEAAKKTLGMDTVEKLGETLYLLPLYHYLHEDHKDVAGRIDAVLQEMAASGELAALQAELEESFLN